MVTEMVSREIGKKYRRTISYNYNTGILNQQTSPELDCCYFPGMKWERPYKSILYNWIAESHLCIFGGNFPPIIAFFVSAFI